MKSENKGPTERTSEDTTHMILKKKKKKARDNLSMSPADPESGPAQPKAVQQQDRSSSHAPDYCVGQIATMLSTQPAESTQQRRQQAKTKLAAMFGAAVAPPGGPTRALFTPRARSGRERQDSSSAEGQRSHIVKKELIEKKGNERQQTSQTPEEKGPSSGKHAVSPSKASSKDVHTEVGEPKKEPPRERYKPTPEETSRTVFVGNLPLSYNKKKLRKLFKKFGEIKSIRFRSVAPSDPELPKRVIAHTKQFHPERNSMNSYVVFQNMEAAQKALKRNGKLIEKNHIRVDLAANSRKHDTKRSVFLGNLPFDVKDDTVREHFEECGTVENVRVVRDGKTGLGKGFGYLLFAEDVSVEFALKMDGSRMAGRDIRVQRATKQKQIATNAAKRVQLKQGGGPKGKGRPGQDKSRPRPKMTGTSPRRPAQQRKSKTGPARSKGKGQAKRGAPVAGRRKALARPKKGKRISS